MTENAADKEFTKCTFMGLLAGWADGCVETRSRRMASYNLNFREWRFLGCSNDDFWMVLYKVIGMDGLLRFVFGGDFVRARRQKSFLGHSTEWTRAVWF